MDFSVSILDQIIERHSDTIRKKRVCRKIIHYVKEKLKNLDISYRTSEDDNSLSLASLNGLTKKTNDSPNRGDDTVNCFWKNIQNSTANELSIMSPLDSSFPQKNSENQHGTQESMRDKLLRKENNSIVKINVINNRPRENRDVDIVRNLVEEKFYDSLNYFRLKSIRRRQEQKFKNYANQNVIRNPHYEVQENDELNSVGENTAAVFEYNSQEFLKQALGDDLFATLDSTPTQCFEDEMRSPDQSVCTCDLSMLVSKLDATFSTISNGMNLTTSTKSERASMEYDVTDIEEQLSILMCESLMLDRIISQVSKALDFCRRSKQFSSGVEVIEAERHLLVAIIKKEAVMNEICKIDYEHQQNRQNRHPSGVIVISKVHFPLNNAIQMYQEYDRYFLCLLCCGSTVLSSGTILLEREMDITFNGPFRFVNLDELFEIEVRIYSMTVLNKNLARAWFYNCFALGWNRGYDDDSYVRFDGCPSFGLVGKVVITIDDVHKKSFNLSNLLSSSLSGNVLMDITYDFSAANNITNQH